MRVRKLPAPSKPGHALFAAAPSWSDLAIPDFSIRQNRPAAVQFAAGLCHPCFTCICGRQLPSLQPFRGRLPKPCTLCQDAATGQPGCRQEKGGPPGAACVVSKRSPQSIIPQTNPPGYSPTRFLIAWTESAPVGFCMIFSEFYLPKAAFAKAVTKS